ncbi:MAG: bifunctional adenosylcobinamide kinase/adenosylcobinamide-phosphate guanylyltransferase [Anaerolineales bacterium]|nr:bifunctional adenosylcobinamide kinase/adenosylcobinamide-phosphate guanylyltransferase [Anaerolineales bacterium]
MSRALTLILGGARSGKTSYALKLAAERAHNVLYVATAEAGDAEMATRIAAHQRERPAYWRTLEAPRSVGQAIAQHLARCATSDSPQVIVLDCLTLLASNVIIPLPEPVSEAAAQAALNAELDELLDAHAASDAHWLVISNEVGLGIVPAYPLGRIYRDVLGRANQRLALAADEVLFMVAGLPLRVK